MVQSQNENFFFFLNSVWESERHWVFEIKWKQLSYVECHPLLLISTHLCIPSLSKTSFKCASFWWGKSIIKVLLLIAFTFSQPRNPSEENYLSRKSIGSGTMFCFVFENPKHQEFQLTNSPLFKGYHFHRTMANQNPAHRLNYGEEKALMPEGSQCREDLNLPGRTSIFQGGLNMGVSFSTYCFLMRPRCVLLKVLTT